MIISQITDHTNTFFSTYPRAVFSHLSPQLLLSCTRGQQCSPLQPSDRSAILKHLNYHCRRNSSWHLLAANSKLVENIQPRASTHCSGDNKEKLYTRIRRGMRVNSVMTGNPLKFGHTAHTKARLQNGKEHV